MNAVRGPHSPKGTQPHGSTSNPRCRNGVPSHRAVSDLPEPHQCHESGPCHYCADRLPRIRDCPLTVALAVALVATEAYGSDDCATCRSVLDGIGGTATVARMELDFANGDDYSGDRTWQLAGCTDGAHLHRLPAPV